MIRIHPVESFSQQGNSSNVDVLFTKESDKVMMSTVTPVKGDKMGLFKLNNTNEKVTSF